MRIEVVGDRAISQQARTYAEYRLFAALTQRCEANQVRRVRVLLREVPLGGGCAGFACTVTVTLQGSDSIRVRTVDSHADAAINSAVERLRTNRPAAAANRVSV